LALVCAVALGGVAGWLSDDDVLDGTSPGRVLLVLILLACVLVVVVAARANTAMLVVGCGAAIAFLAAWGFRCVLGGAG
jgi:hypothetical protein